MEIAGGKTANEIVDGEVGGSGGGASGPACYLLANGGTNAGNMADCTKTLNI